MGRESLHRTYSYKRSDKLAERIRVELAELFLREVEDPRLGSITITGIDVDEDLTEARVRVCKMIQGESLDGNFPEPTIDEKKKVEKALKSAAPFIFERLKRRLQIRHTPWLVYRYDDSLSKSAKVWAILSDEAQKKGQSHESSDSQTAE